MSQATVDALTQIITIVGPAIAAFFVGHYHVLLKPATPAAPAVPPAAPAAPAQPAQLPIGQGGIIQALQQILLQLQQSQPTGPSNPIGPTFPTQVSPIGQGGLLQIISLALQGIMAHPTATPAEKAAAASAVVNATAGLTTPTK